MATKKPSTRTSTRSATRSKTGTSKTKSTKPTATKPATAKTASVKGVSLAEVLPDVAREPLKKKELFERVKARTSGVKGSEVRVVLDAVLDELGALLADGDGFNAQPLGNLKVQKRRVSNGATVVVCKLRRKKPGSGGTDPLAKPVE